MGILTCQTEAKRKTNYHYIRKENGRIGPVKGPQEVTWDMHRPFLKQLNLWVQFCTDKTNAAQCWPHKKSYRGNRVCKKLHLWGSVDYRITHNIISDVPHTSLPMQTVRTRVEYGRQTAIRAVYHQGDANFTGLAGVCRWRHEQRVPVLQARWHCLVNPPLLGNPSKG